RRWGWRGRRWRRWRRWRWGVRPRSSGGVARWLRRLRLLSFCLGARQPPGLFSYGITGPGRPVFPFRRPGAEVAPSAGGDVARGFQFQRLMQECLRHVLGGHLAAEQVAAEIVLLAHAAGLGALGDERVGEQSRADAIGVDRVGADAVRAVVDRVLPH